VEVESYDKDIPPTYAPPKSYVRYRRPTHDELLNNLEYVIDGEDEVWLMNNVRFGGASAKAVKKNEGDDAKPTFQMPLGMLETMLDVMEKATAFEAIITMDQAEALILQKLPQLYHMYPIKARAGVTTLKHVFTDVYNYWVSKRSKLKRPLLRRFWPVTSTDDTNPHLVFRPREKEKYKLRKKRQNDMDAYRKMQQLKQDFQRVRALLDLVKRREELNRNLIQLQKEWFQQKLFDAVDTSGIPRLSPQLRRNEMDELLNVPLYFDTQNSWKKNKKARRATQQAGKSSSSRSTSPVPDATTVASKSGDGLSTVATATTTEAAPMVVAGQNHGEPAPLFVHPLPSRETYVTSWDTAVPHVTSYVDSHPLPTFRFRHRPRVGRGGRLCIDRVPQPIDPNITPVTVFTAGLGLKRSAAAPKERLLDLLPRPLDHTALSRRIEAICVGAMKDEYDMPGQGSMPRMDAEENDGDEIIVQVDDWINTDEQAWGEERFALGPI
jgi:enhancer of polycomb-like protein